MMYWVLLVERGLEIFFKNKDSQYYLLCLRLEVQMSVLFVELPFGTLNLRFENK